MTVKPIARVAVALFASLVVTSWCAVAVAADKDAEVKAKLDRKVPELKFDGVGFSDVLDFMKDVTGAKIEVDWAAVEKAGVKKDAKVTVAVKGASFSEALTAVLDQAAGKAGKLVYKVKDGAIQVAPK